MRSAATAARTRSSWRLVPWLRARWLWRWLAVTRAAACAASGCRAASARVWRSWRSRRAAKSKTAPRGFGQLALRRLPSALEHTSGYPKPRSASFYQPVVSGEFSCQEGSVQEASITHGCSLYHSRLQDGSLGHCVWEASVALSIFLATDGQESVRGRRVLELGAGCGLAGTTPSCPALGITPSCPALGTTALLPGASLKPQRRA